LSGDWLQRSGARGRILRHQRGRSQSYGGQGPVLMNKPTISVAHLEGRTGAATREVHRSAQSNAGPWPASLCPSDAHQPRSKKATKAATSPIQPPPIQHERSGLREGYKPPPKVLPVRLIAEDDSVLDPPNHHVAEDPWRI
jgi:hypothetical protein